MTTLNTYCQILPDKPKEKTDGGIFIPEVAQDVPKSGIVERGKQEYIGKRVYYPSYTPQKIKLGTVEYHFVKEEELILITDSN